MIDRSPDWATRSPDEWLAAGAMVDTADGSLFVLDVAARERASAPPLLIVHGYPSSSFDFRHVLSALSRHRRVVLFDQLGFGLSHKPDRRYGIRLHADAAQAVLAELALDEVDLLTHDMGDTVGGELLARDLEGTLQVAVGRRVLTNGSIYLELAQLTPGQQLLSAAPDETIDVITAEGFCSGLASTFSDTHPATAEELAAQWDLASRRGGHRLLARTIRYLEDRRAEESRFTGAIERHPAPLGVVWGEVDPVAVLAMTGRLADARPGTPITVLRDVGHYPMVESPDEFAGAVLAHLAPT